MSEGGRGGEVGGGEMSLLRSDVPPLQADNLHAVSRGQFIWMFNQMAWRSVKSNGFFSGCGILSLKLVSNVCQFCQLLCHVLACGGWSGGGCPTEMGSMREPDD